MMPSVPFFCATVHYSREWTRGTRRPTAPAYARIVANMMNLDALVRRRAQELKLDPPAIGEAVARRRD